MSHIRFFHPTNVSGCFTIPDQRPMSRQPTKPTEGEEDVGAPSNNLPSPGEQSTKPSSVYFSPPSTVSSPSSEEGATWGNLSPLGSVETPVPVLPPRGRQDTSLNVAGRDVQQEFENYIEPPAPTASTPLSLQCRMCGAFPTVSSRPTATMCGHIFCSECVSKASGIGAAGLTLHQVHHTTRHVDFQMSCVRRCPLVILFVQTRSPVVILEI